MPILTKPQLSKHHSLDIVKNMGPFQHMVIFAIFFAHAHTNKTTVIETLFSGHCFLKEYVPPSLSLTRTHISEGYISSIFEEVPSEINVYNASIALRT